MCSIPLTLSEDVDHVEVRNKSFFLYAAGLPCTVYSNETFDPAGSFCATVVFADLNTFQMGCYPLAGIGLLPADQTESCKRHQIGSNEFPDTLVCTFKEETVWVRHSEGMYGPYANWRSDPNVVMQVRVENSVVSFYINGKKVACPQLETISPKGPQRLGIIMMRQGQEGALMEKDGEAGIEAALQCGVKAPRPAEPVEESKPRMKPAVSLFSDEEDSVGIKSIRAVLEDMKKGKYSD